MSSGGLSRRAILAACVAAPLLLGGCALTRGHLEAPTATLKGVTLAALDRDGQVFLCRLLLENPNTEDLHVVGGRVTLELAGIAAASATPMDSFVLPGLGSREVDMRVTMDLMSALSGALRYMQSGQPDLDYVLKGYVDLDIKALGRLPFKSTGTVTLDNLLRQLPGLIRPVPADEPVAGPAT